MVIFEKNILLTNDDGIRAPGIRSIAKEISDIANVCIIAPEKQQSGEGKALTFDSPLRVKKIQYPVENIKAYTISGTPADGTIFGLKNLSEEIGDFDMTISGINAGENTSIHSMLTSGTVAAVFESALMGVPGVALSLDTPHSQFFNHEHNEDFFQAAKIAKKFIIHFLDEGFPEDVSFFNINFPKNVTPDTPIHETDISHYKYSNYALKRKDPRDVPYYWLWGDRMSSFADNSDTEIVLNKHEISVSAIDLDQWTTTKKYNLSNKIIQKD